MRPAQGGGRPGAIGSRGRRHRKGFDDFSGASCPSTISKESDAAFHADFEPRGDNETVVFKRRFSAFFGTDLALFLHERAVTRVVIAGVKTNVCIRATAQDAFANG